MTSVVAILCLLGFIATFLRPQIPPRPANRMAREVDAFSRQASTEPVDWKPLTADSMAEARRAGRPILLLIGSPTSSVGKTLDAMTFASTEVAIYLSRNFTCLRVDGAARPEWMNAFLPFSRLRVRFQPDLQLWALDQTGRPYQFFARINGNDSFDSNAVLPVLIDLRRRFDELSTNGPTAVAAAQEGEGHLLASLTGGAAVPFARYSESLRIGASTGWEERGMLHPQPWTWRYLLATGDFVSVRSGEAVVLRSPLADLLDGGFFHTLLTDGGRVEFEKLATENAQIMQALTETAALTGDAMARRFAEETWDYLSTYAWTDKGISIGQPGQAADTLRSPRYSVSARRAREALSPPLREWAVANLGLDVARHPQAVPYLERAHRSDRRTDAVLNLLRPTSGPDPERLDPGLADASLGCAARMIATARIWRDPIRLKHAIRLVESLEPLRTGVDVSRSLADYPQPGYLGDYLAYADVRLQDYLATGNPAAFEAGLGVLERARKLFRGRRRGVFILTPPSERPIVPGTAFPEIMDNLHGSCTSRAARLMLSYGRLLGPTPEGLDLQREAHETVNLFASLAASAGVETAGFFAAAAEATDDACLICVGPKAQELADEIAGRLPTRLVAPAFGRVRPELQHKKPGVYLIRGSISGPMSADEAWRRLPATLDLG
ncbi:Thymidylate kinase [Fimbriimonas ginsengisoli Gsoil 348]|uniref:Thymidylate kinase n=1 Tax=Fimbriimonas ginsengisoli Gsoil 348 TaxID=661478 RepID=A0A068NQ98_FIMGI|nr:Thymidylate kinase [Fimbriimonas ginsengisoli Gsoil 348]